MELQAVPSGLPIALFIFSAAPNEVKMDVEWFHQRRPPHAPSFYLLVQVLRRYRHGGTVQDSMANGNGSAVRITDGSAAFEGGIDSGRIPTAEGPNNPLGLKRNMMAWGTNVTMRGGGMTQRTGWLKIIEDFVNDTGLFQGAMVYQGDDGIPYILASISGRIYRFNVWTNNSVADITGAGANVNPPNGTRFFFVQGEQFAIIQVGDFTTNALIWDGSTMRRSLGLAGAEIPPGAAMDYWQGRLWVQDGSRTYSAGNIVYGPSGTAPYKLRDAILKWTENAYLAGGGSFNVPSQAGSIRALKHTANQDDALGQSLLYILTREDIFAMDVPVDRTVWANMGLAGTKSLPLQRLIQNRYGTTSDWSVVPVNTDLFYQSYDGVRSLQVALRYLQQWGQVPISREENRVLAFNDRALLRWGSGIEFNNRLLQTVLPFQTSVGVAHRGLMPLDFDIISNIRERSAPVWEGMYEGLNFLQILKGEQGGLERAFGIVQSEKTGRIQIWELTQASRFDQDDARVKWYIETPAYNWGDSFKLKELDSAELWVDQVTGTVDFMAWYRPDSDSCWTLWHAWSICSVRNSCETVENPVCYPTQEFCPGYRATMTLPKPPVACANQVRRPSNLGFQFQLKLQIHGYCRIRGLLVHALPVERAPYTDLVC